MKFKIIIFSGLSLFSFFFSVNVDSYQVREGDSYYLIGKKFKINYLDIIKLNKGKQLLAGEVIKIPFYFFHVVKDNESLSVIAKKYSVSADDISRMNDLKKDIVYVGQQLKIPKLETEINVPAYIQEDSSYNPNRDNSSASSASSVGNSTETISLTWPVSGRISETPSPSSFKDHMSLGIPIKTRNNDTVLASENGIILYQREIRGFGKITLIIHAGGVITAYMGLKEFSVYENQVVMKGQPIGKSRRQMFFAIFLKGDPQNPIDFLKKAS